MDFTAKGKYSTDIFTNEALKTIKIHRRKRTNRPLFLYLPYQAVHAPLEDRCLRLQQQQKSFWKLNPI